MPVWRQSGRRRGGLFADVLVGLVSVACFALEFVPPPDGYNTPLSFQVAKRDPVAWTLFGLMAVVLAVMSRRLYQNSRFFCGTVLAWDVLALGLLAASPPTSPFHQTVYLVTACGTAGWLVLVAYDLDDWILKLLASAGVVATLVSLFAVGIGERLLIAACLVGIDLIYFDHIPEADKRTRGFFHYW